MTAEERNSVEQLVQTSLRRRALESVENALVDESLICDVSRTLSLPDNTELRQLIAAAGVPVQVGLQNACRAQVARSFWVTHRHSKALIIPLLTILLAIAAAIRLDHIGAQSQWLDEYWAVYLATGRGELIFNLPYGQLIQTPPPCGFVGAPAICNIWTGIAHVTHPPLYYLVLRAWIDVFGDGDVATRGLSTVFSLAAILLLFDIVRRSANSTGQALAAAAMMTFAPAQIDFSQTTRPYTMLLFAALLACDLLILLETKGFSWPGSLWQKSRASMRGGFGPDSRRRNEAVLAQIRASFDNEEAGPKTQAATARLLPQAARVIAFTTALIALALTHYFAIGALGAMALYSIIRLRGKTRRAAVLAYIIALIFVLACWGPMAWGARGLAGFDNYVRGSVGIYEASFNLPRRLLLDLSFETGFLMMWAFAFVVFISPALRWKRYPSLLLWWLWVICVPGFLLIWDAMRHTHFVSVTRYVLLASPAVYAIFATPLPTKLGQIVPAAFVFAAMVSAFVHWQTGPPPTDDLRGVARWIAADVDRQNPIIVCGGPESEPSFRYFALAHYAGDWRNPVVLLSAPAGTALEAELAKFPQVYVVTSSADDRILPGWKIRTIRREKGFFLQIATR